MSMVRRFRILGLLLVFIGIIALLPNQVSAYDDHDNGELLIRIDEATYLDYDEDGFEDDVITIFTVDARDIDFSWFGKIEVNCYLESPSGIVYRFDFKDKLSWFYWIWTSNSMYIGRIEQYGLVWYNSAFEAGWYTFKISVEGLGDDEPSSGYAETEFDPPGGDDPGEPEVGFM